MYKLRKQYMSWSLYKFLNTTFENLTVFQDFMTFLAVKSFDNKFLNNRISKRHYHKGQMQIDVIIFHSVFPVARCIRCSR